jgi:hypothetical protein
MLISELKMLKSLVEELNLKDIFTDVCTMAFNDTLEDIYLFSICYLFILLRRP